MEVIYRNQASSSLNPNAQMFVPMAYRTVEDFSDQWWDLVQSTPWFRDYWLQECFQDPQSDTFFPDDLFSGQEIFEEDRHKEDEVENRALVRIGTSKWRRGRNAAETPRYFEKVPKIVNVKVSPRPIQQPR